MKSSDIVSYAGVLFNAVGMSLSNDQVIATVSAICGAVCALSSIIRIAVHIYTSIRLKKDPQKVMEELSKMTEGKDNGKQL